MRDGKLGTGRGVCAGRRVRSSARACPVRVSSFLRVNFGSSGDTMLMQAIAQVSGHDMGPGPSACILGDEVYLNVILHTRRYVILVKE
jgi:hypothetical protein